MCSGEVGVVHRFTRLAVQIVVIVAATHGPVIITAQAASFIVIEGDSTLRGGSDDAPVKPVQVVYVIVSTSGFLRKPEAIHSTLPVTNLKKAR